MSFSSIYRNSIKINFKTASRFQTNTLVKNARYCEQKVIYRCMNSVIDMRTHDKKGPHAFWYNGKGKKMNYWPGGPESGGCSCAKTNSCAKSKLQ